MSHTYKWYRNEANFGPPIKTEVQGGTHISFEIIPKFANKYVALRRPNAIPGHEIPGKALKTNSGLLYFMHELQQKLLSGLR